MNDADFVVVFNILDETYQPWVGFAVTVTLLFIAGFLALLVKWKFLPNLTWKAAGVVLFIFTIISGNSFIRVHHYLVYRDALKTGKTSYTEGMVENFYSRPFKWESFSVKGNTFGYSDSGTAAGFNHMSSSGGPIHAGQYVRIW
jgi:hypothetical protein